MNVLPEYPFQKYLYESPDINSLFFIIPIFDTKFKEFRNIIKLWNIFIQC